MKIYRVVYVETGETRSLWTSYRSAVGSGAQAHAETQVQLAYIPGSAWKPADSVAEQRLRRVQDLWNRLSHTDAAALDALLDELVRRRQQQATVTPARRLADAEREEAAALLELDRLVDAS